MHRRLRTASLALLATLAAASTCLAAEGMGTGRAGIGGQLGGSTFWADGDYSNGVIQRLAFGGHFRYMMSNHWRWQVSPGFTWTTYTSQILTPVPDGSNPPGNPGGHPAIEPKSSNLTLLLPMTFEVQYVIHHGKWFTHIGAGPGVYRVWVENHRQVLVDPASFRRHQGLYPGISGEIGIERFLKSLPSTSLELSTVTHWVFARDDAAFPTGYNSFIGATEFRIGGNFYFDTSRLKRSKAQELPASHSKK
ncbi:MAG: hypothetical protein HYR74_00835 [Candidatus Eisenbacteria bacterium]|nr:hypothetical protein [Candidatus Eisenbacteria bacterium]